MTYLKYKKTILDWRKRNKAYWNSYQNKLMKKRYKNNPRLRNNDKNQLGSIDTLQIYNTKNKNKLRRLLKQKKSNLKKAQKTNDEANYYNPDPWYYYSEDFNSIIYYNEGDNEDNNEGDNENE